MVLSLYITWTGSRPSGSFRYRWSTFDWAGLHRWVCQRLGQTGLTQRSPWKRFYWLVWSVWYFTEQMTRVASLTWIFRTQTKRRDLCWAARSHWAPSCQTCVYPRSSALCRASLGNKNAGGHVWAAHPLWWSGNSLTSQNERRYPWVVLLVLFSFAVWVHLSLWASASASLPSLWKWLWYDRPQRWRAHQDSCWPLTFWLGHWTPLLHTHCSHTGWPGGAQVPRALLLSKWSCNFQRIKLLS